MPPKSKKLKPTHKTFVRVKLDETVLTPSEEEDLGQNYEISCRIYNRSEDFGSSERQKHSFCNKFHQIQLAHKATKRSESLGLLTISDLVRSGPPSSWNDVMAENAYKVFKVNTYVVNPNNFLCVSFDGQQNLSQDTTDSLLQEIGVTHLSNKMPSWHSVSGMLESFLDVYDGCEDLPDLVNKPGSRAVLSLVNKFSKNLSAFLLIARGKDQDQQYDKVLDTVQELSDFASGLLECLSEEGADDTGPEVLVQHYISILLTYFFSCLDVIAFIGKDVLSMKLPSSACPHSRKTSAVRVDLDLRIRLNNRWLLVGLCKPFGCCGKDEGVEKHRDHRVKNGLPSKTDGDVGCSTMASGQEKKHTSDSRASRRLTQDEVEQLKKKYQNASEKTPRVRASGKRKHSNAAEVSSGDADGGKQNKKCHVCGYKLKADTNLHLPFRNLDSSEEYKVSSFLPELLAGMFACIEKDREIAVGSSNENVRFGFSVEGFKLRLVRLVLLGKGNWGSSPSSERKPTLKDILDQRVRCEVFLTQEINLFKKKHLKMLFQLLFGLTYVSRR